MPHKRTRNHGEGNPEAAKRFNDAETLFVRSPRGKQIVSRGNHVRPDEEVGLAAAEGRGKARSKGDGDEPVSVVLATRKPTG
jgi:hypothetical protein